MSGWLLGSSPRWATWVASTALIYVSTLVGVRLGEPRTLTEMSAFDLVVAIALGRIARTATTRSPPSRPKAQ